jgi:cob(I)alamin adenosyltransferase
MNKKAKESTLMDSRGYVHVYTGNGKGKTTAALGLVLRASGAGFSVYVGQFLKRAEYSEHAALALLPAVKIEAYGAQRRIGAPISEEDIRQARLGLEKLKEAASSGKYGLVVADEFLVAVRLELFSEEDALSLLDVRHPSTELVITGRYAFPGILERADLVTEMKEIRHYFSQGVPARKGIEK